jgi:hypothetical protein
MTLLQQIQEAAIDPKHPLADLLRKCLILSYRLKHLPFREWVERELDGYPKGADLPPYRRAVGDIHAALSGPLQGYVADVPVPMSQLPEDHRDLLRNFDFGQGVAELEALAGGAKDQSSKGLMKNLPMELCRRVEIYEGWSTVRMWSSLSISTLSGVLDQIRTRALRFALEIEALNPAAGEPTDIASPAVSQQLVSQIFNTVISGGTVNLAGTQSIQQIAITVQPGDLDSLIRYLKDQGVADNEVKSLKEILPAESASPTKTPGPKTEAWIKRVGARIAAGGGRVAESTLTSVLSAAVKSYMGLP